MINFGRSFFAVFSVTVFLDVEDSFASFLSPKRASTPPILTSAPSSTLIFEMELLAIAK